ncbi:hypothetical protein N0V85_005745 [Neurospora sp. IMI 360204]|nr:hypothetical protein N0V85_005745 [Neurospora sp. IMI 360204]
MSVGINLVLSTERDDVNTIKESGLKDDANENAGRKRKGARGDKAEQTKGSAGSSKKQGGGKYAEEKHAEATKKVVDEILGFVMRASGATSPTSPTFAGARAHATCSYFQIFEPAAVPPASVKADAALCTGDCTEQATRSFTVASLPEDTQKRGKRLPYLSATDGTAWKLYQNSLYAL